jgi:hypothetical protein
VTAARLGAGANGFGREVAPLGFDAPAWICATAATMVPAQPLTQPRASSPARLVLVLHFHQPHGNLGSVFELASDRCYQPTLELLLAHPLVKTGIHVSGPLLDWLERYRPAVLDCLVALVRRGQTEILGGGIGEPMLAVLPDRDAIGQLQAMAERCRELFGERPRGMWLAERVWEPDLPRIMAAADYHYTLLDDTHLHAAGERELRSCYRTDKAGASVCVLPIDRGLRLRIPFAEVDEVLAYLAERRGRTSCYGDDAEKFGLWPTTAHRTWDERWLERFFSAIRDERAWLEAIEPGRLLDERPVAGPVYLPSISYAEMGEWALPAAAAAEHQELWTRLELAGLGVEAARFVRGGIWQGFFAKYPESRLMQRKMLLVSEAVERARLRGDPLAPAATAALYSGQCNCAYWHGLFGGLYLQHLRSAVMSALLEAECLVEPRSGVGLRVTDHDGDGDEEVLLEGPEVNLYLSPARGGAALELDLRRARFHLTGVLGRRPEAYHRLLPRAQVVGDTERTGPPGVGVGTATEPGLGERIRYDRYPRGAFIDHLLAADAEPERFDADYQPLCDLPHARYQLAAIEHAGDAVRVRLTHAEAGFRLEKQLIVGRAPEVAVRYALACDGPARELAFACEIDVTLLTGAAEAGRRLEVHAGVPEPFDPAPGAAALHRDVRSVRLQAPPLGVDLTLRPDPPAELWRIPIETVSQSEGGFERSYQGTALVFVWRTTVGAGRTLSATLELDIAPEAAGR